MPPRGKGSGIHRVGNRVFLSFSRGFRGAIHHERLEFTVNAGNTGGR